MSFFSFLYCDMDKAVTDFPTQAIIQIFLSLQNVLVLLSIQHDYYCSNCTFNLLFNVIILSLFRDFIKESHKLNSIQCIIISSFHHILSKPPTNLSFHISNKHFHSHFHIFLHSQLFIRRMNFLVSR